MIRFRRLPLVAIVCLAGRSYAATPVILISVDTLRADHLSCYGARQTKTPHIDALAKNGTLFSQVSTPFPLTLPAHVSLFTSMFPFSHGVTDNGVPLDSSAITLATVLQKAGYRTGAFVASFVLDRRFGLARGFNVYDSPFDLHNKSAIGVGDRKRPGSQVAEAASRWVTSASGGPFFLFLHLYDLHTPYDLPEEPSQRHGEKGYAAELTYVDRVLGTFFSSLDRQGLLQKALIVFTSDHGEGLGEHGESSHGYFVYQSTLRVPLLIHWPSGAGSRVHQERVDEPVSLLDVAPTILDAVGLPRPAAMRGRSLIGAPGGAPVYSESTYARNHFGCATLRSLRLGQYKYIDAPTPELYDLSSDPGELRNVYSQQRAKGDALRDRMALLRRSAPTHAPVTTSAPETVSALRSLGYLGGRSPSSHVDSKVDPKDRIADFERFTSALAMSNSGKFAASDNILEALRDKLPDVVDLRTSLGLNLQALGENNEAAREFKNAIELEPSDAPAHFELGTCYFRLGQRDDAIRQFRAALALAPWYTRAEEALADFDIQNKDYAQARTHLEHILSVDPASYTAHFNLGMLAALDQKWTEAEKQMLSAIRSDPGSAEAHNTLGGIYLQRGEEGPAQREMEEAIRLQPKLASAHYNLAALFQKQGKREEALREFHAAKDADR